MNNFERTPGYKQEWKNCDDCRGTGEKDGKECKTCDGSGRVRDR